MAAGLGFRGRGGGGSKSLSPGSRAQTRQSGRNRGMARTPGVDRRSQAVDWQRGSSPFEQKQAKQKKSLFFGASPYAGKRRKTARAGAMDILAGRGGYMRKFQKQRKGIVQDYMKQKSKMKAAQRRQLAEVRKQLKRQDKDVYQEYKIAHNLRPDRKDLDPKKQRELTKKVQRRVRDNVKKQQRGQLRDLRKDRDKNIKNMMRELREAEG